MNPDSLKVKNPNLRLIIFQSSSYLSSKSWGKECVRVLNKHQIQDKKIKIGGPPK